MNLLWQHHNWDVGLIYKRVGQYYNDNGTLNYTINGVKIPYPVDQAITIQPWDLVNVFFNYTIKNSSFLRGTKIQFAVNNLANSPQHYGNHSRHCRNGDGALRAERGRSPEFDARA